MTYGNSQQVPCLVMEHRTHVQLTMTHIALPSTLQSGALPAAANIASAVPCFCDHLTGPEHCPWCRATAPLLRRSRVMRTQLRRRSSMGMQPVQRHTSSPMRSPRLPLVALALNSKASWRRS